MKTGRWGQRLGTLMVVVGFGFPPDSSGQVVDEAEIESEAAEAEAPPGDERPRFETVRADLPADAAFLDAVTPRGACSYDYDDGSGENAWNASTLDGADVGNIHKFSANNGCERITTISVVWSLFGFSGPPVGTPARIHVWDDPDDDGDPLDAVLLTTQSVTVLDSTGSQFNDYALTTPVDVDGVFFIGASIVLDDAWVAAMPFDTSTAYVSGSAFVVANPFILDVNNLGANADPPFDIASLGVPGYFLLRAEATSVLDEISYQGRLKQNGDPYSGAVDVRFTLYDAESGGSVVDGPETLTGVTVADGLFSVCPQFLADSFYDVDVWLHVEVAAPSGSGFVALSPRQPIKPAPQAHYAAVAGDLVNPVSWNDLVDVPSGLDGHSLNASDGSPVDALLVDAEGDVLIGTATTGSHQLRVTSSVSRAEHVQFDSPATLSTTQDVLALETPSGSADDSQFIECTRGGTNVFVVNGNGDVGIGTGAPAAALHIAGVAGTDGIMFPDGSLQTTAATGSADGHSLDASDGDPVDALLVDAVGHVLIGPSTPGPHQLRVTNSVSGAEHVQFDITATLVATQDVLALETPLGSANDSQFIECTRGGTHVFVVNGNGDVGIGTGAPAGTLHVVDATGGDTSVILPNNAIGAAELLDEPGAAESEFDQPTIALDGTVQTLLSTTITAPAAGYALVIASAQCSFVNHTNGTTSDANFGVSNVAGTLPSNQDVELIISQAAPTGTYRFPVTVHGVFPVAAGANTMYFLGQELSGVAFAQDIQLTAVYLPTAYGAVTAMLGDGEPDDPDTERGPMTIEEIEAERMEAIFLEEERIERERQELAAEIEELRALKYDLEALRDELRGEVDE